MVTFDLRVSEYLISFGILFCALGMAVEWFAFYKVNRMFAKASLGQMLMFPKGLGFFPPYLSFAFAVPDLSIVGFLYRHLQALKIGCCYMKMDNLNILFPQTCTPHKPGELCLLACWQAENDSPVLCRWPYSKPVSRFTAHFLSHPVHTTTLFCCLFISVSFPPTGRPSEGNYSAEKEADKGGEVHSTGVSQWQNRDQALSFWLLIMKATKEKVLLMLSPYSWDFFSEKQNKN